MRTITISANKRESAGKGVARKLRASGRIPGTFYGRRQEAISIDIDARELENFLSKTESENVIVNLDIEGSRKTALLKSVQHGPVRGLILHADFYHVAMDREIDVSVPIHFKGTPTGVKNEGGIMQSIMRELEISCLPGKIPDSIDIDVTELNVGDSIHVRDIQMEEIKVTSDLDRAIVTVLAPTVTKIPAAEAVEAGEEAEELVVEAEEKEEKKEED